jgi:hypothetical protein
MRTRSLIKSLLAAAMTVALWGNAATASAEPVSLSGHLAPNTSSGHGHIRPAPAVPRILRLISGCESGHNNPFSKPNYRAQNPGSTASGAYQFLDSTWHRRFGVSKARYAKPWQQDQVAVEEYHRNGTAPWAASKHCWGRAV